LHEKFIYYRKRKTLQKCNENTIQKKIICKDGGEVKLNRFL